MSDLIEQVSTCASDDQNHVIQKTHEADYEQPLESLFADAMHDLGVGLASTALTASEALDNLRMAFSQLTENIFK